MNWDGKGVWPRHWGDLEVNGVAVCIEGGLVDGLGESWVGVNGGVDVINRGLERKSETHFGDQISGIFTDDVSAENLAVFLAEQDLHEAFGLAAGLGFAKCLIREFADLVFDTFFLEGTLGLAHGSDLGIAIGAAREVSNTLDGRAFDKDSFNALHRFEAGGVGEPRRSGDVADGVNIRDGGFVALTNFNPTAVGEFGLLAAGKDGSHADGDEAAIGGDFLGAT